jgi:hypothetical protein
MDPIGNSDIKLRRRALFATTVIDSVELPDAIDL